MAHVLGGVSWALQSNTTRAFNSSAQVGNMNTGAVSTAPGPSGTTASPGTTAQGSLSM